MTQEYDTREERAQHMTFHDIREIPQPGGPTIYEVDVTNEKGETRENLTLIPGIRYEATKDVRYRHSEGVVGKYTLALCAENEAAKEELHAFLKEERAELTDKLNELRKKNGQLSQASAALRRL